MPKLLLFTPCEKVIISQEGQMSLITIVDGFNVKMSAEDYDNLPEDAVAQIAWHIVTKWSREDSEEEEPAHWEQRIQVVTPSGRVSTNAKTGIDLVSNLGMRNVLRVNGFPIRPLGRCKILLSLRKAGDNDASWQEIASYRVKVQNIIPNLEH
jgi:hypothetical protein